MRDFKMGVKLCKCGVNIAETMPACQKCQIEDLRAELSKEKEMRKERDKQAEYTRTNLFIEQKQKIEDLEIKLAVVVDEKEQIIKTMEQIIKNSKRGYILITT